MRKHAAGFSRRDQIRASKAARASAARRQSRVAEAHQKRIRKFNRATPMSGGRASRQKGNRTERAIVRALQAAGFAAERVPLSGSMRGRFGGDISVPLLGVDRRVEVKCRGNGFRQLYDWLGDHDFLIVKADRLEPLVVVPLKFASEIAALAESAKNSCKAGSVTGRSPAISKDMIRLGGEGGEVEALPPPP